MILPREGVHHYGPNGEIVEYAPVTRDGSCGKCERLQRELSAANADADKCHREVGLLQIDVAKKDQKIMELSGELSSETARAEQAEKERDEARRQVRVLYDKLAANDVPFYRSADYFVEWSADEARKGATA